MGITMQDELEVTLLSNPVHDLPTYKRFKIRNESN